MFMFYLAILVTKHFIMNSTYFQYSPGHKYPAIKLDMTNFVEHLSDENINEKVEVRDDGVHTNPIIIDCKTEDCTGLGEISLISGRGLEREEKVRKLVLYTEECTGWW